jgi:hypothetical protein
MSNRSASDFAALARYSGVATLPGLMARPRAKLAARPKISPASADARTVPEDASSANSVIASTWPASVSEAVFRSR